MAKCVIQLRDKPMDYKKKPDFNGSGGGGGGGGRRPGHYGPAK